MSHRIDNVGSMPHPTHHETAASFLQLDQVPHPSWLPGNRCPSVRADELTDPASIASPENDLCDDRETPVSRDALDHLAAE